MTFAASYPELEEEQISRACNGWNCLAARPDDEDAYGWQDGYCRECQAEIAKQEAADSAMRDAKAYRDEP